MLDTAVILAAGLGSRLSPGGASSEQFSKPLLRIGDQTLLERTVSACRFAGLRRILVVTGFRAHLVEREVRRLSRGDLEVVHNPDWTRKNGLSVHAVRDAVDGPFALMMADHVFDATILRDLVRAGAPAGAVSLAVDYKVDEVFDLDDATKVRTEGGRIVAIGKGLRDYDAIDCGLFACTPAVFAALRDGMDATGDCSISDGMTVLARAGRLLPFDIGDRWWQDVDTPEMAAEAADALKRSA